MAIKQMLLKDVLKGTSIDPKIARRKLRAKFGDRHEKGTTWSFSPAMVKQVKTLLGITKAPAKKARKPKAVVPAVVPAT